MSDPVLATRKTHSPLNILIFGGTGDANRIAEQLQHHYGNEVRIQLSLAGRTSAPSIPDGVLVRIGGFGGPDGIIRYIGSERIDLVIDATHPFASKISQNIAKACHAVLTPCIQYTRPAWTPEEGDNWILVNSLTEAAKILPDHGTRALIATGRQGLQNFEGLETTWLLVRSIEAPKQTFNIAWGDWIYARGPFSEDNERELIERYDIDVVVCKNSGGTASYGKILAARALGLPVIMVQRPAPQPVEQSASYDDVVQKVATHISAA